MADYYGPYVEEHDHDGYSNTWTDSADDHLWNDQEDLEMKQGSQQYRLGIQGQEMTDESPTASSPSVDDKRRGDFAFTKVEQEGLSETLQVHASHDKPFTIFYSLHGDAKHAAWNQPKTALTQDDATCELLNVYALQHTLGGEEFDKITLTCLGGPQNEAWHSASIQLRWLHVQRNGLTLELLKDLVFACPYVSRDLSIVTARLLEEIRFKYARTSDGGAYLEPGSIMRYICQAMDDDEGIEHQKAKPILFLSCPQLVMRESVAGSTGKPSRHNYHPRTLLQTIYHYDTGGNEMEQSVQRVASRSDQILHVNELWYLLIGSNVLITMSDLPAKSIQGKTVTIDKRPSGKGGVVTIQLFENGRQHNSVVDAACTYADLARHCVLLATGHPSHVLDYELLDSDHHVLTPYRWLELLSVADSYHFEFYLLRKKAPKGRDRRDYSQEVASDIGRRESIDYSKNRKDQDHSSADPAQIGLSSNGDAVDSSRQYGAARHKSPRPQTDGLTDEEGQAKYVAMEKRRSIEEEASHSGMSEQESVRLRPERSILDEANRSDSRTSPKPHASEVYTRKTEGSSRETTDGVTHIPSVRQEELSQSNLIPPVLDAHTDDDENHDGAKSSMVDLSPFREAGGDQQCNTGNKTIPLNVKSSLDQANRLPSHPDPTHRRLSDNLRPLILQGEPRSTLLQVAYSENSEQHHVTRRSTELPRKRSPHTTRERHMTHTYVVNDPDLRISNKGPKVYRLESAHSASSGTFLEEFRDSRLAEISHAMPSHNHASDRFLENPPAPPYRSARRIDHDQHQDDHDQFSGSGEATPRWSYQRSYGDINDGIIMSLPVEPVKPEVFCFPFLTWKLQRDPSLQDHVSEESTLAMIMDSVNQTLLRSEIKVVYFNSFVCTLQQLKLRNAHWTTPSEERPFIGRQEFKKRACEWSDLCELGGTLTRALEIEETKNPVDKTHSPVGDSPEQKTSQPPISPTQRVTRPVANNGHTMNLLVSISDDILSAFIPNSGMGASHDLSKRVWGALNNIFRQLNWESSGSEIYNHLFTIANFDAIKEAEPQIDTTIDRTWQGCQACSSRKTYMSVTAALDHLHTHMTCSSMPASRPYEDSCYSWVECLPDRSLDELQPTTFVLETADGFIETVSLIRDQVKQLQVLVARSLEEEARSRPPLATSLVDALAEILKLYVLQAKAMTYTNRVYHDDYLKDEQEMYRGLLKRLQNQERGVRIRALRLLRDAKKDIMLLGTTGQGDMSVTMKSSGAEFLLIWLVNSTQNDEFLPTDSLPSTERRDSSYIEIYRRYVSKLYYQASRRPKRRVFKDIHQCQEELAAVNTVNKAQHTLLGRLVRLLDPESFRITNETRIGRFRAEKALARRQQHRLEARARTIRDLVHKTAHLKDNVRQMMEIIDEKAIRVFTIVTLFFLPLSFVSSFMGMNTADIRGMDYSQSVFWATAVPVTVTVVAVALLYGQYGDEIGDWVHYSGWFPRWQRAVSGSIREKEKVRKQGTAESFGF